MNAHRDERMRALERAVTRRRLWRALCLAVIVISAVELSKSLNTGGTGPMSQAKEKNVTLANIAGGAAEVLFARELDRVLENIADPNTSDSSAREITVKVTIKPKNREMGLVTVQSASKLGAMTGEGTLVYIGRLEGRMIAVENNPRQAQIDFDAASRPVAISGGKEGGQ